jgi:hypothetical protein
MNPSQNAKAAALRALHPRAEDARGAQCAGLRKRAPLGWDLSRATLSKIEAQLRCVTDGELEILAKALKVEIAELFPSKASRRK